MSDLYQRWVTPMRPKRKKGTRVYKKKGPRVAGSPGRANPEHIPAQCKELEEARKEILGRCSWCNDVGDVDVVPFTCHRVQCSGRRYHRKCRIKHELYQHGKKKQ